MLAYISVVESIDNWSSAAIQSSANRRTYVVSLMFASSSCYYHFTRTASGQSGVDISSLRQSKHIQLYSLVFKPNWPEFYTYGTVLVSSQPNFISAIVLIKSFRNAFH